MIADVWTVMWKEWRELLFSRGSLRGIVLSLVIPVGFFGILLPSHIGIFWVKTPLSIFFWAWLPLSFVMGVIADAFAGERERHTLETLLATPLSDRAILLGKIGSVAIYAWVQTAIVLLLGVITVNLVRGYGKVVFYPLTFILGGAILGLLATTLYASVGTLISLQAATVRQASQTLVFISIALTWLPFVVITVLPRNLLVFMVLPMMRANGTASFLITAIALFLFDFGLLFVAVKRFQRSRLILD